MGRRAQIQEMLDPLKWLQGWYYAMCDGDWEHGFGPKIGTYDNPGWSFEVVLSGTGLEDLPLETVLLERHEHDWVSCRVEAGQFRGAAGPLNLDDLINVFRSWAAPHLAIRDFPEADQIEEME